MSAGTLGNEYTAGGTKFYIFTDSNTGTTSTCQMPVGKRVLGVSVSVNSATGRAVTNQYTLSTGVLTIGGLTSADSIITSVQTD